PPQPRQDFLALGVAAAEHGAGAAPDDVMPVQPAADRLAADVHPVLAPQQQRGGGAAPAAAPKAEGPWRPRGDPTAPDGGPAGAAPGGAPGAAEQAVGAAILEAPLPAGDGAAGAEQDGGDGGPGMAGGQQQDDVGAQAELGVGVRAVAIQQGIAFIGRQLDTELHGLAPVVKRVVVHPSP